MNITSGTEGDRLNPTTADESRGEDGGKRRRMKGRSGAQRRSGKTEGFRGTFINYELSEFRRLQAPESHSCLECCETSDADSVAERFFQSGGGGCMCCYTPGSEGQELPLAKVKHWNTRAGHQRLTVIVASIVK